MHLCALLYLYLNAMHTQFLIWIQTSWTHMCNLMQCTLNYSLKYYTTDSLWRAWSGQHCNAIICMPLPFLQVSYILAYILDLKWKDGMCLWGEMWKENWKSSCAGLPELDNDVKHIFGRATKSKQCCLRRERGKYVTFILFIILEMILDESLPSHCWITD